MIIILVTLCLSLVTPFHSHAMWSTTKPVERAAYHHDCILPLEVEPAYMRVRNAILPIIDADSPAQHHQHLPMSHFSIAPRYLDSQESRKVPQSLHAVIIESGLLSPATIEHINLEEIALNATTSTEQYNASLVPARKLPTAHLPEGIRATSLYGPSQPLCPVTPAVNMLEKRLEVPEYREKIAQITPILLDKKTGFWGTITEAVGWTNYGQYITFAQTLLKGHISKAMLQVQYGPLVRAIEAYLALAKEYPFASKQGFICRIPSAEEQKLIDLLGVDIMQEAEKGLLSRQDFLELFNLSFNDIQKFTHLQQAGDLKGLEQAKTQLQAEIKRNNFYSLAEFIQASAQLVEIERLTKDPITIAWSEIVNSELDRAKAHVVALEGHIIAEVLDANIKTLNDAEIYLFSKYGCNPINRGQILYKDRPDCPQNAEISSLGKNPLARIFATIKQAPLPVATAAKQEMEDAWANHLEEVGIKNTEEAETHLLETYGFNCIKAANEFYNARPDVRPPMPVLPPDITPFLKQPFKVINAPLKIIDSLETSKTNAELAEQFKFLICDVAENAYNCDYVPGPEIPKLLVSSVFTIEKSTNPLEVGFHVAAINHVLTDVQDQIALKEQQPLILPQPPHLLVNALAKYFEKMEPEHQINHLHYMAECAVNAAQLVCDITVGKLYLSPEEYQRRQDQFWQGLNNASPSCLAALSTEQWTEGIAQIAADFTYGMSIATATHFLTSLDCAGITAITNVFRYALRELVTRDPVFIAEHIGIRNIALQNSGLLEQAIEERAGLALRSSDVQSTHSKKGLSSKPETPLQRQTTTAANMYEVFEKHPLGKLLSENAQKTKGVYDGATIYKSTNKIPQYGIKKGDYFYLDKKHGNHIEVFNGTGTAPRTVLNLDGSVNIKKLNTAIDQGRQIVDYIR